MSLGVEGASFHVGNFCYKRDHFLVLHRGRHGGFFVYADFRDSPLFPSAKV